MFQPIDFFNTKSDEVPWIEPFQVQWNLSNNDTIGTIIALNSEASLFKGEE